MKLSEAAKGVALFNKMWERQKPPPVVALALITCDRPHYAAESLESLCELPVDHLFVVDDGSTNDTDQKEMQVDLPPQVTWCSTPQPYSGVAVAKNLAVTKMLDTDADYLFLCEDDIVARSPEAISGYVGACERSGWQHLAFHGHGPFNPRPIGKLSDEIIMWGNWVGAWCVYTRKCFEEVGLFDAEHFYNSWEHVYHSVKLAQAGLTPMPPGAADVFLSERWLGEITGSYEASVVRRDPDWATDIAAGQRWWFDNDLEAYRLVWPQGDPDDFTWGDS